MPNGQRSGRRGLPGSYAGRGSRAAVRAELKQLARELAARFAFTEGDVAAVLERVRLDTAWTGRPVDRDLVWAAARRQPEHALERLASLVTPAFSLDDLVLTDEAHAKLRELLAHVALQHVVLDDWGFRRRLPRGQGVAALFAGPSGTGKTTAAEALAGELAAGPLPHRPLRRRVEVHRRDGEEPRRPHSTRRSGPAPSSSSTRPTRCSASAPRSATRTTATRTWRSTTCCSAIETFTGLVILASNRQSALDEAFLRRLRFVIRFELPDADLRRRLWRRSFPDGAKLAELDWGALAAAELAGGSIQSAALAAAYLAAADGGTITSGSRRPRARARAREAREGVGRSGRRAGERAAAAAPRRELGDSRSVPPARRDRRAAGGPGLPVAGRRTRSAVQVARAVRGRLGPKDVPWR